MEDLGVHGMLMLEGTQCAYKRTIEALSRNSCCRGKTISVIYSECVSVALGIQHAKLLRRIFVCGLSGCTIFFHII